MNPRPAPPGTRTDSVPGTALRYYLDQFFGWTVYGREVRWLGANSRLVHLALFDSSTPIWYRLTIDRTTHRVVREDVITQAHFMTRR